MDNLPTTTTKLFNCHKFCSRIMKYIRKVAFLLLISFLVGCSSQSNEPQWYGQLQHPTFVAPSADVQKQLRIPILQGDLYGICDYKGKILLKPQFEDIEMPAFDLPFVKAKKNGEWSLYDLSGKQILPFTVKMAHLLNVDLDYKGLIGNEYRYIAKVRDPREAYLKVLPNDEKTEKKAAAIEAEVSLEAAPRFYYFSKNTKAPLLSWFAPDDREYYKFSRKTGYHNGLFTSSVFHGFVKVMDENRRFTLLDKNMEPVFKPQFNCASLSSTKAVILNESGLCALRDLEQGWQTSFQFRDVKTTDNPDICWAEAKGEGKSNWYKVSGRGNLTPIEGPEDYLPLNARYSRISEKMGEYQKRYYLFDEKTGQKVRELKNWYLERIFETGFGLLKNGQLIGIETIAGDTIFKPPFPAYTTLNDSTYSFTKGDTIGLGNRRNKVLFQTKGALISEYGEGYFHVSKDNGKIVGLIRADGRVVLPVEFERIYPIRTAKRLLGCKDGLWGMFDWSTGKAILQPRSRTLQPNAYPFWYGGGIEIRSGEDFFLLGPNLEIVYQKTQKPILTKLDFPLKNPSAAVKADYEKSEMPMYFNPYTIFKGPNWLHIFKCSGEYIASLEGFSNYEMAYSRSRVSNSELGNASLTGVASLTTRSGKKVWVRLEDGQLYQK